METLIDSFYNWAVNYAWWTHFKESVDWVSKLAGVAAVGFGYRSFNNWLVQKKVDKHVDIATNVLDCFNKLHYQVIKIRTTGKIIQLLNEITFNDLSKVDQIYKDFDTLYSVIDAGYFELMNVADKSKINHGEIFDDEIHTVFLLIDQLRSAVIQQIIAQENTLRGLYPSDNLVARQIRTDEEVQRFKIFWYSPDSEYDKSWSAINDSILAKTKKMVPFQQRQSSQP